MWGSCEFSLNGGRRTVGCTGRGTRAAASKECVAMVQNRFARIFAALLAILTLSSWMHVATASADDFGPTGPPAGSPYRNPDLYKPRSVWVDAVHGLDANTNPCLQTAPCRTLNAAMYAVGSHYGSTIYLAPGEYDGNWVFADPIHLIGTGSVPSDVVVRPDNIPLPHLTGP